MARKITDAERIDDIFMRAAPDDWAQLLDRVNLIIKTREVQNGTTPKRMRKTKMKNAFN